MASISSTRSPRSLPGLENPVARRIAFGLASLVMGGALGLGVLASARLTAYQVALLVSVGLVLVAMAMMGDVRKVLLVSLALTIPISISFSPFVKGLPDHPGGASSGLTFETYDFPLMGLAALWLAEGLALRRQTRTTAVHWAALLLITWSAVSIFNSVAIEYSLFEVLRMVKLFLLSLIVAALVKDARDVKMVLGALMVGLIFEAAVSAVQYLRQDNFGFTKDSFAELGRAAGTIGWPNTLGAYAASLLVMAASLWVLGVSGRLRMIAIAATAIGLLPVVLSFSRGAWLSLLVAIPVGFSIAIRFRRFGAIQQLRAAQAVLVMSVIGLFFGSDIATRLARTDFQEGQIVDRLRLAEVALNMISAHPILGVGINNFVDVMRQYDRSGVTFNFAEPVHNIFLIVAAETGLVGLGLFLWLLVAVLRHGLRAAGSANRPISVMSIAILTALVGLITTNLMDVHLRTDVLYGLFWTLIGLVLAVERLATSPPSGGSR